MKDALKLINPECDAVSLKMFYTEETYEKLFEYVRLRHRCFGHDHL